MIRCFFNSLGHTIAKWPIVFAAISLALSLFLSCGMALLQLKDHIRDGYTPENAPSWDETAQMRHFWNSSGDPMKTLVLIRSKLADRNMLRLDLLSRSVRLHQFIQHEFVSRPVDGSAPFTYSELCHPYCDFNVPLELFVDGLNQSMEEEQFGAVRPNRTQLNHLSFPVASVHSFHVRLEWFFFGVSLIKEATTSPSAEQRLTNMDSVYMIQLTFNADRSTPTKSRQLSLWEMSLYDFLRFDYSDPFLDVQVIGMDILDNEMTKDAHETVPFFTAGLLLIIAFVALNVFGTVSYRNAPLNAFGVILLIIATVACPLLAISGTYGAMALFGLHINSLLLVMPYLVLGIGVDDGFLLMHRWFQLMQHVKCPSQRMQIVLADIGPSITVTTLTNVISFGIGAFTPTPEIRLFCFGIALALTLDYSLQVALFCPIMQFSAHFEQKCDSNDQKALEKMREGIAEAENGRGSWTKEREEGRRGGGIKEREEGGRGGGTTEKEEGREEEREKGREGGTKEGEGGKGSGTTEREEEGGQAKKRGADLALREPCGGKRKWSPLEEELANAKKNTETGTKAVGYGLLETYCALLENRIFAIFLLFALCCYWYGSVYGSLIIQSKLDTRKILPKGSKLQETFTLLERFVWADHFTVTVNVNGILNVSSTEQMKLFYEMVNSFEEMPRSKGPTSSLVWLRDFERFCHGEDGTEAKMALFVEELELLEQQHPVGEGAEEEKGIERPPSNVNLCLLEQFLDMPFYAHWAPFVRQHLDRSGGCPSVYSFILMFAYQNVTDWDMRIELMEQWRAIAKSHSQRMPWLNLTVWEQNAQFVDQMLSLPAVTVHSWLLTMCCMLFVCALFVPNPVSIFFAGISISSVSVGVFGFLSWLHFDLDPITMAATLMSIGLSVDFTAHVTYHFRQSYRTEFSTDKSTGFENVRFVPLLSQEDKLRHTLAAVGWPMFQSGVSTALCICPLLFTQKYSPRVFVCAIFLVSALGLLHGLLVLPSVLCLLPAWCTSARPLHFVANFLCWRRKLRIWNGKAATKSEGDDNLAQFVEKGGEQKKKRKWKQQKKMNKMMLHGNGANGEATEKGGEREI